MKRPFLQAKTVPKEMARTSAANSPERVMWQAHFYNSMGRRDIGQPPQKLELFQRPQNRISCYPVLVTEEEEGEYELISAAGRAWQQHKARNVRPSCNMAVFAKKKKTVLQKWRQKGN
jgi:hypothetical protein